MLLRAGKQHVKRLLDAEGRMFSPVEAMEAIRQRRVVRMIDLHKVNKHSLDELDPEVEDVDTDDHHQPVAEEPHHHLRMPESSNLPNTENLPENIKTDQAAEDIPVPDDDDDFMDAMEQPGQPQDEPPDEMTYSPTTPAKTEDLDVTETPELPEVPDASQLPVPDSEEEEPPLPPVQGPFGQAQQQDATLAPPPAFQSQQDETFEQRRRRLDQQETIWLRGRRPLENPQDDKVVKKSKSGNEIELAFYNMTGDNGQIPADLLPEGWTYDPITNDFHLGPTKDFLSVEQGFLVRNHVLARTSTWRPDNESIKNMPIPMSKLQQLKITMKESSPTMMVDSVTAAERQLSKDHFFGKTLFPLTKDAAQKAGMPYINLSKKVQKSKIGTNFPENSSETWVALSNQIKKKKESEADLRESKMTLEDRLTFLTAKKAELQSIFENQVWELELEPEKAEASRILKARFVLKWADDGKGGTKAKARLVLQGFADPDLLSGKLQTSSPTLNRTSRQVLLAIGTMSLWEFLCADVATGFLQGDQQHRALWLWCKLPRDACDVLGVKNLEASRDFSSPSMARQMHLFNGSGLPRDAFKKLATPHILWIAACTDCTTPRVSFAVSLDSMLMI